ncbi:MAG: hypothetical protein LUD46_23335 [Parabacteroides sp.]|nr:hypothetical protein [Parabacteroides sp.]
MKQGTSTITTVFSNEIDGVTYEYTVTQLAGKTPQSIQFAVRRDINMLASGSEREKGSFSFETFQGVTADERKTINDQINADLVAVKALAEGIDITSK